MSRLRKIFLSLVLLWAIVAVLCWQSNGAMAVESLLVGQTDGGSFSGVARYFATGTSDETAYETQQQSNYYGNGTFPSVLIYQKSEGAIQREEQFTMAGGWLNTLSRAGTSTLTTSIDPDNEKVTNGVLIQNAAGVSNNLIGAGTVHALFTTSGGIVMRAETMGTFTSGRIAFGAIERVTTGSGPTDGGEGARSSTVTVNFEEHYRFGAFSFKSPMGLPIGAQYSVSFNPLVSVIPVSPVP